MRHPAPIAALSLAAALACAKAPPKSAPQEAPLPPIDEAALGTSRQRLATKAGPVAVYDFASEGQKRSRVIAGLASAGDNTWFVKMSGDAAPVAAARADFLRLLESLRFESQD